MTSHLYITFPRAIGEPLLEPALPDGAVHHVGAANPGEVAVPVAAGQHADPEPLQAGAGGAAGWATGAPVFVSECYDFTFRPHTLTQPANYRLGMDCHFKLI